MYQHIHNGRVESRFPKVALTLLVVTCAMSGAVVSQEPSSSTPKHFVFFGRDRERILDSAFLANGSIAGAQLTYTWRELEPERDRYDFQKVEHDIAVLERHGKRLFLQLQDVSFSENARIVQRVAPRLWLVSRCRMEIWRIEIPRPASV